ncbi:MAG: CoA-binding protein [Nitrospirae bacterium]|nr:CoA-binding protein [Nitrospirota bacterium]
MAEKSIAIIGASSRRDRFANKAVRAYAEAGYTVYAVHPKEDRVEGLPVYRSVADIPGPVAIANLYVAPAVGIDMLEGFKAKGIKAVYANPGAASPELLDKGRALGLEMRPRCSILAIGRTPSEFPDE